MSICDGFHTRSGTTAYAHVWALGMAWWTFPLFGGFVTSAGAAYVALHTSRARVPFARLAIGVLVFVALYAASAWLPATNAQKLAVLGAGAALLWLGNDRTPRGALLALGIAAIGTFGEAALIAMGTFWYGRPDFLGVPIWLPALYAAGATALGHVACELKGP